MPFIEKHRKMILCSPFILAVVLILMGSVNSELRSVTDFMLVTTCSDKILSHYSR